MGDLREFYRGEVIPLIAAEVAKIFATQGYGTWPQRKDNLPHPLLQLTGRYLRAASQVGASGNIAEVNRTELRFGIELSHFRNSYPLLHETGTSRLPARPVWSLLTQSDTFYRALDQAFNTWLDNKIQQESRRFFK